MGCSSDDVEADDAADAALDGEKARTKLPFEAPRTVPGHRFAPIGVAATMLYQRWKDGQD